MKKLLLAIGCYAWSALCYATPLEDATSKLQDFNAVFSTLKECPPAVVCPGDPTDPTPGAYPFKVDEWKHQWKDQEKKNLPVGYTNAPWLTILPNGRLELSAEVGEPTTPNSHYSRSQLRQTKDGKDAAYALKDFPDLVLKGVTFEAIPEATGGTKRRQVVYGQSHGKTNELNRTKGEVKSGESLISVSYVNDKSGKDGKTETEFPLLNAAGKQLKVPFGDAGKHDVAIRVKGNVQTVTASYKGEEYKASEVLSSYWAKEKGLYHCVDAYLGVGKPGSGAGSTGPVGQKGTVRFDDVILQPQQK